MVHLRPSINKTCESSPRTKVTSSNDVQNLVYSRFYVFEITITTSKLYRVYLPVTGKSTFCFRTNSRPINVSLYFILKVVTSRECKDKEWTYYLIDTCLGKGCSFTNSITPCRRCPLMTGKLKPVVGLSSTSVSFPPTSVQRTVTVEGA